MRGDGLNSDGFRSWEDPGSEEASVQIPILRVRFRDGGKTYLVNGEAVPGQRILVRMHSTDGQLAEATVLESFSGAACRNDSIPQFASISDYAGGPESVTNLVELEKFLSLVGWSRFPTSADLKALPAKNSSGQLERSEITELLNTWPVAYVAPIRSYDPSLGSPKHAILFRNTTQSVPSKLPELSPSFAHGSSRDDGFKFLNPGYVGEDPVHNGVFLLDPYSIREIGGGPDDCPYRIVAQIAEGRLLNGYEY